MRVTTYAEYDKNGKLLHEVTHEYVGPVAEMKKGREQEQQVTQQSLQNSAANTAKQNTQYSAEQPFLTELTPGKNGELSPYAAAQYNQDLGNIHRTYKNNMNAGLRMLSQRGMGSGPTGGTASVINTANNEEGAADTQAYQNAENNTLNQGLAMLQNRNNLQSTYNPNPALQTAGNSAYQQSQMGSTLGDIASGLGTAAGLALSGAKTAALV